VTDWVGESVLSNNFFHPSDISGTWMGGCYPFSFESQRSGLLSLQSYVKNYLPYLSNGMKYYNWIIVCVIVCDMKTYLCHKGRKVTRSRSD